MRYGYVFLDRGPVLQEWQHLSVETEPTEFGFHSNTTKTKWFNDAASSPLFNKNKKKMKPKWFGHALLNPLLFGTIASWFKTTCKNY